MNNARRCVNWIALLLLPLACQAQRGGSPEIHGTGPNPQFESIGSTNYFRGGVEASNSTSHVIADSAAADQLSGDVTAEGDVTILDQGHIWRGTNFTYNFTTGQVRAGSFKSVQGQFNLTGQNLAGSSTNSIFTATNALITTDDYETPGYHIRARRITIKVGEYFEAHEATLFWGRVPVFYYPYYHRSLTAHPNNWEFAPGYRSIFGPYLLSAYNWYGNEYVDGTIHADMRERRGFATGPDLTFHMGDWGEAAFRYYYAHDNDAAADGLSAPHVGQNRQKANIDYLVTPTTNLTILSTLNYQSDPLFLRDYFEGAYKTNIEPSTYAEATQTWPNYTLDVMAQPRVVNFFETVQRLPELKLSGARQEIGDTPIYYENESSAGFFKRSFSETNSLFYLTNYVMNGGALLPQRLTNIPPNDYSGSRFDTFHQFSLPQTFFDWLNVRPYAGGRLTYYGEVTGLNIHTNEQLRAMLDTGMDVSFKASRVYADAESPLLDVHGLRHIIEPEIDYAYIPNPTRSPSQVPQFDYQSPSLRLLPIEYPDNNNIDSIGGENVVRFTLRNKLQTKRGGQVEDLLNWAVYTQFSFHPQTNHPFSDLYSDLDFHPRQWLTLSSSTRYDMANTRWREAIENISFHPGTAWSLQLNYRYLINNDPELQLYPGENLPGHNLFGVSLYYRFDENWGIHLAELYEAQYGGMQQQVYSVYRDLRSWTASLMLRVTQGPAQPTDYTVALMFSLKAFPRFSVGSDSDKPGSLFSGPGLQDPPSQYGGRY